MYFFLTEQCNECFSTGTLIGDIRNMRIKPVSPRENKVGREGILHTCPFSYVMSQAIFRKFDSVRIKLPRALRGYFVEA